MEHLKHELEDGDVLPLERTDRLPHRMTRIGGKASAVPQQLTLRGIITTGKRAPYAVNGDEFYITDDTWIVGDLEVGCIAEVRGHYVIGVGFHLGIALLMQLGIFQWGMLACYPVLFRSGELQRAEAWLTRRLRRTVPPDPSASASASPEHPAP